MQERNSLLKIYAVGEKTYRKMYVSRKGLENLVERINAIRLTGGELGPFEIYITLPSGEKERVICDFWVDGADMPMADVIERTY